MIILKSRVKGQYLFPECIIILFVLYTLVTFLSSPREKILNVYISLYHSLMYDAIFKQYTLAQAKNNKKQCHIVPKA